MFERVVALCAVFAFAGFAIAGCVDAHKDKTAQIAVSERAIAATVAR